MRKEECYLVIMHFRDPKEARAVVDAASLDPDRMFRIEMKVVRE
jgi:hypothetical protein